MNASGPITINTGKIINHGNNVNINVNINLVVNGKRAADDDTKANDRNDDNGHKPPEKKIKMLIREVARDVVAALPVPDGDDDDDDDNDEGRLEPCSFYRDAQGVLCIHPPLRSRPSADSDDDDENSSDEDDRRAACSK